MFSPCDPEWVRLNSRKRNVAHRLRTCEGMTPPAGGFLPAVLFVFEITTREWAARFLGVIFLSKILWPCYPAWTFFSNSKVWRAWLEMERRNGNVWQARTEIPLSSPQKLSVNACLQNKPIISLALSHHFVTLLLSIKLPLLPDIDVTIFCPGLRMFARKHHEKQWVLMCGGIWACVWQIIWKGLTRDLMSRSASWDQCW